MEHNFYRNVFARFKAHNLLFCSSLLSTRAKKPFIYRIEKKISLAFLKDIKIFTLFLFFCFLRTGFAYKSNKKPSSSGQDGHLSLDAGFYAKQNTYNLIQVDKSDHHGFENNGFGNDYTESSKDFGSDTDGKTENDSKKYFQSFSGSYIPLYLKRAIINSLKPIRQMSSKHLTERNKLLNHFIGSLKRSFSESSNRLKEKNMINRIHKRSSSEPIRRSQVYCVNFLEKLEDSSLNRNSRNCFKEAFFFSQCPNIFDIPCLCRSSNYKSHIALCIYQKSLVELVSAYSFASELCSRYSSLPSSCISFLMANSQNLYKRYDFKDKIDTSKESSGGKACSKSYSIFSNFSISTLIFIVVGTGIFLQTGILSLI